MLRHCTGKNLAVCSSEKRQNRTRTRAQSTPATERQELFNKIAPAYDLLNDVLSGGLHRVWKAAAVQWSRARPGDTVLDICCGSGDVALRLAAVVGPTGRVTGLDFALEQLAVAARREAPLFESEPGGRARVNWTEGDATALPFEDASFDAATCGYGLRNVVDQRRCLAELARVLRPSGRAVLLDFNHSESEAVTAVQSALLDTLVVPAASLAGLTEGELRTYCGIARSWHFLHFSSLSILLFLLTKRPS